MKGQYVKTDALINCKNARNSEGTVTVTELNVVSVMRRVQD